mgnify:CR=1 FL=1
MANETALLDLSTDKFIAHINIDGEPYGLIDGDNLSILEQQRLGSMGKKLAKVAADVKTDKEETKYNTLMAEILGLLMPDASKDLIGKLSLVKKYQAINAYNETVESIKKRNQNQRTEKSKN